MVTFGPKGDPVKLAAKAGGQSGLQLDVRHWFTTVEDDGPGSGDGWRVTTRGYDYRILDSQGGEIITYHWDPSSRRGPTYPHMHVSATAIIHHDALNARAFGLEKLHLPTGRVLLGGVVRMLISELGVRGRMSNWPTRLSESDPILHEDAL